MICYITSGRHLHITAILSDGPTRDTALQWHHNEHNGVSNHQPHDCLLNRLFKRRSKKISKLCVTGLCEGIHRWPGNSPHKGPVTRKILPFDDVIMVYGYHYSRIKWALWLLNLSATRMLFQHSLQRNYQSSALQVLCEGNPSVTGGFRWQRASNADRVFMS